jgi:hyperosmotically inducible periplasmic protein
MKAISLFQAVALAACVSLTSIAFAQSASAPASVSVTTPKSIRKADRKLAVDVRRAFDKTQGLQVSGLFVRARGGAVSLTGTVPDAAQIPLAGDAAKKVPGVGSVSNRLTVQTALGH